jgi:hypothetical protein
MSLNTPYKMCPERSIIVVVVLPFFLFILFSQPKSRAQRLGRFAALLRSEKVLIPNTGITLLILISFFSGKNYQLQTNSMIVNKHFVGREVAMDILTNSHSNWKQLTNREYGTDSATEYYTETNEICSEGNLFV